MDIVDATLSALLADSADFKDILLKFSSLLKSNFENRNLWLRFGLTYSLSKESPQNALQAFNECMRIDQEDPLPAMLAAKLLLEDLDDPEQALVFANAAIKRCQIIMTSHQTVIGDTAIDGEIKPSYSTNNNTNGGDIELIDQETDHGSISSNHCYKDIVPMLSKSYILASISHASIHEREPESIRSQFKTDNLKASLDILEEAAKINPNDYLIYFHKALHEAKQRTYSKAINNLRHAIQINPHHLPSMQLLILCLSALRQYEDALLLCKSVLHEHENNLLLLYIKCNLEQNIGTEGYKDAFRTAQLMLSSNPARDTKNNTNLFNRINPSEKRDFLSELSIWIHVAEIFVKIGSVEDAEMCVDEGSIHASSALSHQVMYIRGLIAKARNHIMEAKTYFQSCLALYPKHPKALQQLAHVQFLMGNYTTAEKFLRDSLDLDRDCHTTWSYLSLVYIEMNQHDKASECAKKSTDLEESSPVVPFSAIPRLTLE